MRRVSLILSLLVGLGLTSALSATNYAIFIHGRGSNNCSKTIDDASYWGTTANITTTFGATTFTKKFVNYDGTINPTDGANGCSGRQKLKSALTTYCGTGNSCYIICHSAGCLTTDYVANVDATFWAGRNIGWMLFAASAAGGSELANAGGWATGWGMDTALKTGNARGWGHNAMGGRYTYNSGGNCPWYSTCPGAAVLPGYDDGAVAPHSACGHNTTAGNDNCLDSVNYSYHRVLNAPGYTTDSTGCKDSWDSSNQFYTDHTGVKDAARKCWNAIWTTNSLKYWDNNT